MRSGLKRLARSAWNFLEAQRLESRLSRTSGAPRVLYAGQCPLPGQIASGGAVKLIDLARQFPEGSLEGNILYLVTSVLPRNAEAWVKVARRKGIRVVLNQNGVAFPAWASAADLVRINERNAALISQADWVLFQSEFCRRAVERWVSPSEAFKDKCSILHNPIDLRSLVLSPGIPGRVLVLGSHHQPERVRLAIEAVALLRRKSAQWSLEVAGALRWSGAEADFRRWTEEFNLGNALIRRGPYRREQASSLVGSAQVVLHLQDKDASPTVPLEAQATGAAVVGIATGGMPELVQGVGGELLKVSEDWNHFHYPSVDKIADALARVPHSAEVRLERRKQIEKFFAVEAWRAQHSVLFESLLKR